MKHPSTFPLLAYLLIPFCAVVGSVFLFLDGNDFGGILLAVVAMLSTPSQISA